MPVGSVNAYMPDIHTTPPDAPADKKVHEQGLGSVLKELHDDLDAAVFEAYGWPVTLTDAEILEKFVTLNAERAAEEARGLIRWLRPEYQVAASGKREGAGQKEEQPQLGIPQPAPCPAINRQPSTIRHPWPKTLPEQVRVLREILSAQSVPATAKDLAKHFTRVRAEKLEELLETLVTLGQARKAGEGMYVGG